ncbi:MAG: hypothetical protein JWR10_3810 [Rubritepida sp.]|nr:hypothetical protein [Rubritepida sp.]
MSRLNIPPAGAPVIPIHEPGALQIFAPSTELERMVTCALLGERQFYVNALDIEERIRTLAAAVEPEKVATIAVEARLNHGLRHAPLLLLVCLAARPEGRSHVRDAAARILRTPRDAMDLLALYWKGGKIPLPGCLKAAFRDGFARWSDYQVAKYATLKNVAVRLRDVAFLSHPKPAPERVATFTALANDELRAPGTWETLLSAPGADKRAVWEALLREKKLGALALVRNLRNMEQVGVEPALVREAMAAVKSSDVWPWQALAAVREAPAYTLELDALMLRAAAGMPRIGGVTGILVDVSGSMNVTMSDRGTMKRLDAAAGLAAVLREACDVSWIAPFSMDTVLLDNPTPRGAALAKAIVDSMPHSDTKLGAAVHAVISQVNLDRLIVVTDEQARDQVKFPDIPTFVINVASTQRGVAWGGQVTRINGWSAGIVRFLAQDIAGLAIPQSEDS